MALPRLSLACLALVVALTASSVAASSCPPQQDFSGQLSPGSTITIPVTTTAKGDTYFLFMPKVCSGTAQTVTMTVKGDSMTGNCGLGIVEVQAAAGTYQVHLDGRYLNVGGLGALPFKLVAYQSHCA